MKPFVALGASGETLLTLRAGYRPLGAVMGVSVVQSPLGANVGGLDGTELRSRTEAAQLALKNARMRVAEQARALGASGVIGVAVRIEHLEETPSQGVRTQIQVTGTAVLDDAAAEAPFLTNLHGAELVALQSAGYLPVGLAVGYAFYSQIPGYRTTNARGSRGAWGFRPFEHPDYTRAVAQTREIAVGRLHADAEAANGEGIVGVALSPRLKVSESALRVELIIIGTAVRRDRWSSTPLPKPAIVKSLKP